MTKEYNDYEIQVKVCAFSSSEMIEAKNVFDRYFEYDRIYEE